MLPGLLNLARVVTLARVELGLLHQVRHTNDGVHGGSDFVAHVGQEFAFLPRCTLGDVLGQQQLLSYFTELLLARLGFVNELHVACGDQAAIRLQALRRLRIHPAYLAIVQQNSELLGVRLPFFNGLVIGLHHHRAVLRVNDFGQQTRSLPGLLRAQTQQWQHGLTDELADGDVVAAAMQTEHNQWQGLGDFL